jgi:hypothetical protein
MDRKTLKSRPETCKGKTWFDQKSFAGHGKDVTQESRPETCKGKTPGSIRRVFAALKLTTGIN